MKNNKGITLIALIITIIVMLILAGISLTFTIGDEGVISKAENAKEEKRAAEVAEIIDVWNAAKQVDILGNNGKRTTKTFNEQVDELVNNKLLSEKEAEIVRKHGIIKIGSRLITILDGAPKFQQDMKAVYWDENNNEITSDDKNFNIENYYSYTDKRWANAKTSDGSYWVWVPRYAYCITEGAYSSTAGTIEIEFIDRYNELNFPTAENVGITIETDPNNITYKNAANGQCQEQYLVHPAFTRNADNGGGFGEITGIWVAKFEMSAEKSNDGGKTWSILYSGNKLTTNAGNTSENIRVVSKPNMSSWYYIDFVKCFFNSKYYDISKKSHLIKNSEWGAVTYLSYSEYGTNKRNIDVNTSRYTGGNDFKNKIGQSTSQTIYGIYDLNGCHYEYTAGIWKINNTEISDIVIDDKNNSTGYKTIYNEYAEDKKGDAIYEISKSTTSSNYIKYDAWFGESNSLFNSAIFLKRGNANSNLLESYFGFFTGSSLENNNSYISFRACLVVD